MMDFVVNNDELCINNDGFDANGQAYKPWKDCIHLVRRSSSIFTCTPFYPICSFLP